MKRSEINHYIAHAKEFLAGHRFYMPPFAFWTPQAWAGAGHEADEIRARKLGWDVTDFGEGRYEEFGLLLFTLRNGALDGPGKKYAEKIMIVREGQQVPFHFHWVKTEDIINRGGAGVLKVELYNSTADGGFADTPVTVSCDGVQRTVPAGGFVELGPGESITLIPGVYHAFTAKVGQGHALIGEVSSVNDDANDNRMYKPIKRFPTIEEDASPLHLMCGEYPPAKSK